MTEFKQINVGVIGTGWVGGIRANACAQNGIVNQIHVAEINSVRQKEIKDEINPTSMTDDWKNLIADESIDLLVISMTPETERFPIVIAALEAGKHVFVEKPLAPTI